MKDRKWPEISRGFDLDSDAGKGRAGNRSLAVFVAVAVAVFPLFPLVVTGMTHLVSSPAPAWAALVHVTWGVEFCAFDRVDEEVLEIWKDFLSAER